MKWDKAVTEFNIVLMNLGEKTLPAFTVALEGATGVLRSINRFFEAPEEIKAEWRKLHGVGEQKTPATPGFWGGFSDADARWKARHNIGTDKISMLMPPPASSDQREVHLHTTVSIDGKAVGEAAAKYVIGDQAGDAMGPTRPDARSTFVRPGD